MAKRCCYICKKNIDIRNHKYVLLGTYNISKEIQKPEEEYFHFECFRQWELDKTKQRAMNMLGQAQQNVAPMINQLLKGIQGNQMIQETLQQLQPVQTFEITPVEKEKKKDGRRKRAVRKTN